MKSQWNGILLSACVAVLASGCASLTSSDSKVVTDQTLDENVPQIVVEIRPENKPKETLRTPWKENVRIQHVLEQSGAVERFSNMEVFVNRPIPNHYGRHNLSVTYEPETKHVSPETDFALFPGDHVVITQDTTSQLDEFVKSMIGPLGRKFAN